jgi:hypothetical protein
LLRGAASQGGRWPRGAGVHRLSGRGPTVWSSHVGQRDALGLEGWQPVRDGRSLLAEARADGRWATDPSGPFSWKKGVSRTQSLARWSAGADRTVAWKLVLRHGSGGAWTSAGGTSPGRNGFDLGRSAARSETSSPWGGGAPTPAVTRRHSDQVCVIDAPRRETSHRFCRADLLDADGLLPDARSRTGAHRRGDGGLLARKGAGWFAVRTGCVRRGGSGEPGPPPARGGTGGSWPKPAPR